VSFENAKSPELVMVSKSLRQEQMVNNNPEKNSKLMKRISVDFL
jgi:hypothetical protein